MKIVSRLAALAALFGLLSTAALAGSGTIPVLDGNGVLRTYQITSTPTNYLGNMVLCDYVTGANCAGVDASHNLGVVVAEPLPAGTNLLGHIIVDSGTVSVSGALAVTQSGGWTVGVTGALPAGTNVLGHIIVDTAPTTAVSQSGTWNVGVTGTPGVTQSGTWNVGLTGSLPAGTNLLGHIIVDSGDINIDTSVPLTIQGRATASNPSYTEGGASTVSLNLFGAQRILPCDVHGTCADYTTTSTVNVGNVAFAPNGTYSTPLVVGTSSASVGVPAASAIVQVSNVGANTVYFNLGTSGAVSADTTMLAIQAGSSECVVVGSNTFLAAITSSGSSIINLAGGTGACSGFGGSGAGGGGGGGNVNITQINGATVQVAGGASGTGTLRVMPANDAPALSTASASTTTSTVIYHVTPVDVNGNAANYSNPGSINITQLAGSAIAAGNGATSAQTQRVTIANDSTGTVAVTNAGTFGVQPQASTTGGSLSYTVQPAASDNHAVIKNGAGTVYSIDGFSNAANINYVRLYDAGTGFNGCNSATGLLWAGMIPGSTSVGGFTKEFGPVGRAFTTGLSICVTGGYGNTDTTNASATQSYVNVGYK
jgi:hypothetical protein